MNLVIVVLAASLVSFFTAWMTGTAIRRGRSGPPPVDLPQHSLAVSQIGDTTITTTATCTVFTGGRRDGLTWHHHPRSARYAHAKAVSYARHSVNA